MKNNLPWFAHDNDAASHPKHKALRARYGWEGYGRFWALNEIIARADGCRLDLRRPVIRASFATELGLSDAEMDDFLAFLGDPDLCGLIHYEDGVVTTDRTQEGHVQVSKRRKEDQRRYHRGAANSRTGNAVSGTGTDTQHSTAHNNTKEQSRAEDPPAAFSFESLQEQIRCHGNNGLSLNRETAVEAVAILEERDCADPDYIDFVLEKMVVKRRVKPINNPVGFFLQAISEFDDWRDEWRRKRPARIRCPDCGISEGRHAESCPQVTGQREEVS